MLPQAQIAHIKRAVRAGRAKSVSAYISHILAKLERQEALEGLVADLIAQHGEPTQNERAWARRTVSQRPKRGVI